MTRLVVALCAGLLLVGAAPRPTVEGRIDAALQIAEDALDTMGCRHAFAREFDAVVDLQARLDKTEIASTDLPAWLAENGTMAVTVCKVNPYVMVFDNFWTLVNPDWLNARNVVHELAHLVRCDLEVPGSADEGERQATRIAEQCVQE